MENTNNINNNNEINNNNDNNSILSSIGSDLIGIMSPVSICMLLVVLLVYSLSSPLSPRTPVITAANLVYSEIPSDPTSKKLEGALENALVFVALITFATFLIVLLYYFNFTRFLNGYMTLSSFVTLGMLGGSILVSLIQNFSIPIDYVTFSVILFNFSVVGVFSIFAGCVPIVVKQGYTVTLGMIVAVWFTKLPEWTTWALLVALALYDLVAVLVPGGPLRILVELATRRNEELPALVYEARRNVTQNPNGSSLGLFVGMASRSGSVELQEVSRRDVGESSGQGGQTEIEIDEESSLLAENIHVDNDRAGSSNGNRNQSGSGSGSGSGNGNANGNGNGNRNRNGDGEASVLSDHGIRLGLGDFVFYSVLVGRAAMYDLMTVYACYLAIICGLGCTLILLAVFRHALPALPISIMLGITFYFLTRLLMEPFVVGTSTNLMMF